MQEKIDVLLKEIADLKEQIADLEIRVGWHEDNHLDSITDVVITVQDALEFSDLDDIQCYTDENVIILHTNCFRTAALAKACRSSCDRIWCMHTMPIEELTPELLSNNINRSQKGEYILLKSNIFSLSDEFEKIIIDAIAKEKVFFAICTNKLENIPQTIREKMRIIQ